MLPLVLFYFQLTHRILLQHHISKLSRIRNCAVFSIQVLQPYISILHTYTFMKRLPTPIRMLLKQNTHLPPWLIELLRHLKFFTYSSSRFSAWILILWVRNNFWHIITFGFFPVDIQMKSFWKYLAISSRDFVLFPNHPHYWLRVQIVWRILFHHSFLCLFYSLNSKGST